MGRLEELMIESCRQYQHNNIEGAIRIASQAVVLKRNSETLEHLGFMYTFAKKYDTAIELFKEVLEKEPKNFQARNKLADCYFETSRINDAKSEFEHILELEPWDKKARIGLGDCYKKLLKNKEAITEYARVIADGLTAKPIGWIRSIIKNEHYDRKNEFNEREHEKILIDNAYLSTEIIFLKNQDYENAFYTNLRRRKFHFSVWFGDVFHYFKPF